MNGFIRHQLETAGIMADVANDREPSTLRSEWCSKRGCNSVAVHQCEFCAYWYCVDHDAHHSCVDAQLKGVK